MPVLRPFVVFSDDWGRWPSSSQHLFAEIAQERDVLWVETFGMRRPRPTRADVRRTMEKLRSWGGAALVSPWALPPERMTRYAAPLPPRPAAALASLVRRRIDEVGFKDPHLVISVPIASGVVGRLGEASAIYYRVDDFVQWPGYSHAAIAEREELLLKRASGLVVSGPQLDVPSFEGERLVLPHGVDADHFGNPGPRPEALPEGEPILLFAGRIDGRIDATLLADLPGRVVLLGRAVGPLPDGVLHLPAVGYDDLSAWLAAADVVLLPYARGRWTDSLSPLKLPELLASGTPVASTRLPDVERVAGDAVFFGDGPEGFRDAVRRAQEGPGREPPPLPSWAEQAARLTAFADSLAPA
ncbi:MAG: glycosyltransferase family 1 protein [Proteobacteria bacterium]|nr:glycosyltransferase family 1 protein [Pseudomonadota bacterium]